MSSSLSLWQVGLAALLLLVNVGLSWRLRLGLERDIIISSARMVAQLLLVGLILEWVFALEHPLSVVVIGLVMTALAGQAGVGRVRQRYPRVYFDSFIAVFGSSFVLTGLALTGILRIHPWFSPQFAVPILGMVLGNTLTGVSLSLDRFTAGRPRATRPDRGAACTRCLALGSRARGRRSSGADRHASNA